MTREVLNPLRNWTGLIAIGLLALSCSSTTSLRSRSVPAVVRALEVAETLIGTPYCLAGATPRCFDCSGFVSYCFGRDLPTLPRKSEDMFNFGLNIQKSNLILGDLVFFRTNGGSINHVGIVFDDGMFIHSSTSRGVMVSPLTDSYWAPRYAGARRIR